MRPIVHGLEAQYGEEVDFVYLNIDDPASREAKREYGFRYQPYFVLVDGEGQVVQQWLGLARPEEFEGAFAAVLDG